MLKVRATTSANGANLVQENGPLLVSIEKPLMGKKRKHLLVQEWFRAQFVSKMSVVARD